MNGSIADRREPYHIASAVGEELEWVIRELRSTAGPVPARNVTMMDFTREDRRQRFRKSLTALALRRVFDEEELAELADSPVKP